ncbi:TlpA disulfide reductase family protein [Sandarakinorhabdus sp.]|uniref:peroxiredoxin family protein n=1 Tax=Sandarakinorhabdus sp. TaxID=1916663 RepID=UPI0028AFEDAA|nr:TlpA disulfide reductase family protein [Sandarakinorhabdus sp.]
MAKFRTLFAAGVIAGLTAAPALAAGLYGQWRVSFDAHPGGPLPFTLDVREGKTGPQAWLVNAPERLKVEQVQVTGDSITLIFPSYNSKLELKAAGNDKLSGTATVLRATGTVTLAARAQRGSWRFTPTAVKPAGNVTGRWNLTYGDNKVKGLVLLKQVGSQVSGTVQLPTGDMRYLSGELNGTQLKLSTFDGSFTNLWTGTLVGDTLKGAQFAATSRPTGNAWEAKKERQATMNAVLVEAPGGERLSFRLPTPEGQMISLNDARYKGKVVVITLGGAWCPNCHDEAIFMGPYAARRQKEGLEMIGLQFEYGTDQARAMRQITSFKNRYKLPYPMVYGGQPNAEDTKKVLGDLAPVKVWPSTIFIGRDGRVKEVHVGWAGPATGALSEKVKREFDETVTKLLRAKA